MSEKMTLKQACNETRQFGRMLKGMAHLAEVAEALESADQAVGDRRREETAIVARIEERTAQLAVVESSITAAAGKRINIEREATDKAAEILAAAREEADKTLSAARADEATARENAKDVIAKANSAERRVKAAEKLLAETNEKLEQAKAEARKIFGS